MAASLPSLQCAAATVCSAGRCEETLAPWQTCSIVLATVLPILLSLLLPRLDSLSVHEDSLLRCAICTLPLKCGSSAHLAILFSMVMTILPTFFMLALSSAPCSTAVGACATISCAAGSVYFEGYVFMFSTLLLASTLLVREFSSLPAATRSHRRLRASLVAGSLGMQLTGIFPMHFTRGAPGSDNWYFEALALHALGLLCAAFALVNLPFWSFVHARHMLQLDVGRVLGVRLVHVVALAAYVLLFFFYRSLPDSSDFCSYHKTPASCAGWANLSEADCATLENIAPTFPAVFRIPTGHPVPTTYSCGWHDGSSLTEEQRLLLPHELGSAPGSGCRKQRCTLYENALSIALEFGCLYLIATYGFAFAVSDVRWIMHHTHERVAVMSSAMERVVPCEESHHGFAGQSDESEAGVGTVKLMAAPHATPCLQTERPTVRSLEH